MRNGVRHRERRRSVDRPVVIPRVQDDPALAPRFAPRVIAGQRPEPKDIPARERGHDRNAYEQRTEEEADTHLHL